MTSETRRDPRTDTLLTPENSALVVIDFQPTQIAAVRSMDQGLLARNAVTLARIAKQRDWARIETAGKIRDIVVVDRLLKGE